MGFPSEFNGENGSCDAPGGCREFTVGFRGSGS
jgi:hypothetical protein